MCRWINDNLYWMYSSILFLFIINTFIENIVVTYIVGILAIPMLGISFLGATRLFRIMGTIFLGIGVVLYIYSGLPIYQIPLYTTSTMPLLAFLTVLPWMHNVVRSGRFDRRINEIMKANVADLGKLYVRSSFTTYILCTFINLSALPLTQDVLKHNMEKMKKNISDSFISRTTLRAFALALAWSPMEIMVAITVDATGISYLSYLPWLFLCSMIIFTLDSLWSQKRFQSIPYQPLGNELVKKLQPKKIIFQIVQLIIALTTFLVIVVAVGNYFMLNFILSVTLVILPFSIGWAIILKRWHSFCSIGWKTWKVRTNNMQNFVVLFLSLAFFSSSLNETPFLQAIQQPFLGASDQPVIILFLIQMTYLAMSMIGVHPIATIGVLIEVLPPLYTIVNPVSIGLVLITGALATATVGTYGVTVTMTSMNTHQNPYRITVRNMPFALFYGAIGVLVGFLLL
ncbi:hypothetical protein [Alkalihalobacillus sp. BA299]|uniref:hypothetical protein n=1 Tax=Alkalihalobacillus sp. BA299 TaxID=2815938 RepID=UPI001ADD4A06|nr:hypothetical protein [Alkalihalobacillus sp. BA299]